MRRFRDIEMKYSINTDVTATSKLFCRLISELSHYYPTAMSMSYNKRMAPPAETMKEF